MSDVFGQWLEWSAIVFMVGVALAAQARASYAAPSGTRITASLRG